MTSAAIGSTQRLLFFSGDGIVELSTVIFQGVAELSFAFCKTKVSWFARPTKKKLEIEPRIESTGHHV